MYWPARRAVSSGSENSVGADLLQTLVFGWLTHPDVSLEMLASMAATRQVQVTDTAVHKRFTKPCAQFLHTILEEMTKVVVEADREVPLALLHRFEAVVLEDSSSIALPDELAACWQGCSGAPGEGRAAVKLHVQWDLKRGHLRGPCLTPGRTSDRSSLLKEEPLLAGSLYIADWGYVDWGNVVARRTTGSYTLTRAPAKTPQHHRGPRHHNAVVTSHCWGRAYKWSYLVLPIEQWLALSGLRSGLPLLLTNILLKE
jgi:hypothetical protein